MVNNGQKPFNRAYTIMAPSVIIFAAALGFTPELTEAARDLFYIYIKRVILRLMGKYNHMLLT